MTDVSQTTNLSISTAHRLLYELELWSILSRSKDGLFRVATPLWTTGADAAIDVRTFVRTGMTDLADASGAPVRFGILTADNFVSYVEKLPDRGAPLSLFSPAATLPIHATALGKALIAFASSPTIGRFLAGPHKSYTRATITSRIRLEGELRRVRQRGFAVAHNELEPGWSAIAVPVAVPTDPFLGALEIRVPSTPGSFDGLPILLGLAARAMAREFAQFSQRYPIDSDGEVRQSETSMPRVIDKAHGS